MVRGQSIIRLLVRLALACLPASLAAMIKHTARRQSQGGTGCGRMTGHCLSPWLVSPPGCMGAEQTDLFTARERASAVRAALKEWLGWLAGGPAVGCGWLSQTGKRRGPKFSFSLGRSAPGFPRERRPMKN